jgi:hypothetical protein
VSFADVEEEKDGKFGEMGDMELKVDRGKW